MARPFFTKGMFGRVEWKAEKENESLFFSLVDTRMEMENQNVIPFPLNLFFKKSKECKESFEVDKNHSPLHS